MACTDWSPPGTAPTQSSNQALVTLDSYLADSVQQVSLTGGPTGGTFTLSFSGQTTAPLAYNATPDAVQSALKSFYVRYA